MSWSQADAAEAERRYTARLPLSLRQTAWVLGDLHRRGAKKNEPDRRLVLEKIADGRLRIVDDSAKQPYWTVSAQEVDRFLGVETRGAA
jgi:hypothetical protein